MKWDTITVKEINSAFAEVSNNKKSLSYDQFAKILNTHDAPPSPTKAASNFRRQSAIMVGLPYVNKPNENKAKIHGMLS